MLRAASSSSNEPVLSPKKSAVINISSSLASLELCHSGHPCHTQSAYGYPYCPSKAALNMITRMLSLDLKQYGILVASIDPGWVQTDMGGEDADLTPDQSSTQIIQTILQLTSDHTGGFFQYDRKKMPW